ncbi:Ras-related protein Rab-40C, partial [Stegodyphus mimosarum]
MYDVTNKATFDEVPWWLKEIREHISGIPILLVGNKNDDGKQTEVLEELAQDFAEENRLYLYQASARDNVNVSEVFDNLAAMMLADKRKAEEPDESTRLYSTTDSALDVRKIYLNSQPET